MSLKSYLVVTAYSPDELENKCQAVMTHEEQEDDFTYFYIPLGSFKVIEDINRQHVFMQVFIVSSEPHFEEVPRELIH